MTTINVYITEEGQIYFYRLDNVPMVRHLVTVPEQIADVINKCLKAGDYQTFTDSDEHERLGKVHLADDILSSMTAYVYTLMPQLNAYQSTR